MIQNWSSMITPEQSRAARGLLNWSQTKLGEAAGLSLPTVKRFETSNGVRVSEDAMAAIRSALEAAGIEFINHSGVKLRA
jgi:transcriptional regulator with XRE-family HTH domain